MLNKVQLHGRLTKDPEVHSGNTTVARFTVAVDDSFAREKRADYISCVSFGKTAELIQQHFYKGKEIIVFGKIQTGSYSKDDGTKIYTTDVVVNEFDFCGSKGGDQKAGSETGAVDVFVPVDDDESLPF